MDFADAIKVVNESNCIVVKKDSHISKQKVRDAIEKVSEHKRILEERKEYEDDLRAQGVRGIVNPTDFLVGYHKGLKRLKRELG